MAWFIVGNNELMTKKIRILQPLWVVIRLEKHDYITCLINRSTWISQHLLVIDWSVVNGWLVKHQQLINDRSTLMFGSVCMQIKAHSPLFRCVKTRMATFLACEDVWPYFGVWSYVGPCFRCVGACESRLLMHDNYLMLGSTHGTI